MSKVETKSDRRRAEIAAAVADHLLRHGLRHSGIRALAESAGLSDRMLMYYFDTKEALLTEALMTVAAGLIEKMESHVPNGRVSSAQLIDALVAAGRFDEVKPLLRLFFEMVGRAMRDEEPYKQVAKVMMDGWQLWIESKLRTDQSHKASDVTAQIEGYLIINLLRDNS